MFQKNPEKLEAKALDYERRGKTAKAQKYREKAARARGSQVPVTGATTGTATPLNSSFRTPGAYEQRALKWEQRGNYQKAQKNREKVWRLQNPQATPTTTAPMFYQNNQFTGYNQGLGMQNQGLMGQQGGFQQGGFNQGGLNQGLNRGTTTQNVLPAVVETHVHPTIIQQTSRPEKIIEVQPVVHREIDQPSVHIVERHSYESIPSNRPGLITNQPIVQETLHPRVIEEIQPVVHREVPAPFIERVEQHVTERVVQPTTMTKDVINDGALRQGQAIAAGGPLGGQGLNQGGLNQPGFNQGGLNQGGLNQGGLNQGGLNQGGLGQPGFNQGGLNQGGLNQGGQGGLGQPGFNQGGLNSGAGLNQGGLGGQGLNQGGFNQGGLGQGGLNQGGLNSGAGLNSGLGTTQTTTTTQGGLGSGRRL